MSCLPCQDNIPETNPPCTPAPCATQPCTETFEGRCVKVDGPEIVGLPCFTPGETTVDEFIQCLFSLVGVKKIINIINQHNELKYDLCQIVGQCGLIPVSTTTSTTSSTTSTSTTTSTTTLVPEFLRFEIVNNSGSNVNVDLLVQSSNFSTTYLSRSAWQPLNTSNEVTVSHLSDAAYVFIDNNSISALELKIYYSQNNGGSSILLQTINLNAIGFPGSTGSILALPIPRDNGLNGNNVLKFVFTAQTVTTTTTQACVPPTNIDYDYVTCPAPSNVIVNVS